MTIKDIVDVDFVNYKVPSMFIIFPTCTFKCDRENKCQCCQNLPIIKQPDVDVSCEQIVNRYLNNPITKSVVCGGLEPFDSFSDLHNLVCLLRSHGCDDIIVIYTGYREDELRDKVSQLSLFKNIVVKFGRYMPNQKKHYDEVLGVYLASDNQYAKKIS